MKPFSILFIVIHLLLLNFNKKKGKKNIDVVEWFRCIFFMFTLFHVVFLFGWMNTPPLQPAIFVMNVNSHRWMYKYLFFPLCFLLLLHSLSISISHSHAYTSTAPLNSAHLVQQIHFHQTFLYGELFIEISTISLE